MHHQINVKTNELYFPTLREGTTIKDSKEAQFAHSRSCCTEDDTRQYHSGCMACDDHASDNAYEVNLSSKAKRMQLDVAESTTKERTIANKKVEIRKNILTELDAVLNDPEGNEEYQEDCIASMQSSMEKYWSMKNELDGLQGGGEGQLELYGKTHKRGKQPNRLKMGYYSHCIGFDIRNKISNFHSYTQF